MAHRSGERLGSGSETHWATRANDEGTEMQMAMMEEEWEEEEEEEEEHGSEERYIVER